jgi:cellulose synthase (UDP-forming)
MLRAAAVVASWFGIQVKSKPIRFSVVVGDIPRGNVVVFANSIASLPSSFGLPEDGPSLNIRTNPSDPDGTALILAGADDDQVLSAALSLAVMKIQAHAEGDVVPLLGNTAQPGLFVMPSSRQPDDAPRWLRTDALQRLWLDDSEPSMETDGSEPLPIYFRLPPDLYYGENQNINLNMIYGFNAGPLAQGSAMRVFINGTLVNEAPLAHSNGVANRSRTILLPVEKMRPFGNTLLVNFDFVPLDRNLEGERSPPPLRGDILRASSIDLRQMKHWAAMPDLELFANAGFPFTKIADLAETVVVMPQAPSPSEIVLLLDLMSHFGSQTGYPCLRVEIAGPDAVMRGDKDYLILGNINDQPAFDSLASFLPVTFDASGVHVKATTGRFDKLESLWRSLLGEPEEDNRPENGASLPELMIEGIENPNFAGRSVVVLELKDDAEVERFTDRFLERSQSSDISQSVSIFRNKTFTSYGLAASTYHIGNISEYAQMRIWLTQHSLLLLLVGIGFCFVLAGWISDYLKALAARRLQAARTVL